MIARAAGTSDMAVQRLRLRGLPPQLSGLFDEGLHAVGQQQRYEAFHASAIPIPPFDFEKRLYRRVVETHSDHTAGIACNDAVGWDVFGDHGVCSYAGAVPDRDAG